MGIRRFLCRSRLFVIFFLLISLYIIGTMLISLRSRKGDYSIDDYSVIGNDDINFHFNVRGIDVIDQHDKQPAVKNHTQNVGKRPVEKCKEKKNLVFIKCMKCATETVGTIVRRFGYVRNLSFVTPKKDKIYIGWPYFMTKHDYRPSSRGYNIIMEHAIYNKTFMEKLMPEDTVYVSIIREPFSHVKSTIHYFRVTEIAKVPGNDSLSEYFHNIEKYDAIYQLPESRHTRYCIPNGFSLTKNLLSHCLGMPLGFPAGREDISHDQNAVHRYIEQLGGDFSLIMLMEYFHESLVLLKRKMCWNIYDIVYKSVNSGVYSYKKSPPDPELVSIHKTWSSIDYTLYDYFNKTFWKRVAEEGSDFFEEVAEYSKIQMKVSQFCEHGGELRIEDSKWSVGFTMVDKDCELLGAGLLKKIQLRHDKEEKTLLEQDETDSIKPQALC